MHACIWKSRGAFPQPPQLTCTPACMTMQPAICMSESLTLSNIPPRCASDLLQGLVWFLCFVFKVEKLSWKSAHPNREGLRNPKNQWKEGAMFSNHKWKKVKKPQKKGWGQQNSTFSLNLQSYVPFCLTPSMKGLATITRTCNTAWPPTAQVDCPS